jgi:hypothetical protein
MGLKISDDFTEELLIPEILNAALSLLIQQ